MKSSTQLLDLNLIQSQCISLPDIWQAESQKEEHSNKKMLDLICLLKFNKTLHINH